MEFLTLQALCSRRGCRWIGLGPLQSGVLHPFPSVLPLTTRCRSLHRRALSLSGDDDSAALPPLGVVALSEPDPEMTAMLSRAARLSSVGVALVLSALFLCHSSRKCMRSLQDRGRHLSLPETNLVAPAPHQSRWQSRFGVHGHQPPPLCGVSRVFPHGPVSIRQA